MNDEKLQTFRIEQLESGFAEMKTDMRVIRDTVLRLDARFGSPDPMPEYTGRLSVLESRSSQCNENLKNVNIILDDLKSFKKMVLIWGSIVIFLANIIGPVLVQQILPKQKQTVIPQKVTYGNTRTNFSTAGGPIFP